jgi:hypothetical protein
LRDLGGIFRVLQDDRHLTTEQLSAFLDGQAEIEEHLKTCAECRLRLADLQQTVLLLRQLPQPALPRSFVLPTSTSTTTVQPARHLHAVASKPLSTTPPQKKTWPGYVRVTVRTLSTLAAVIGIFFLLSGLFSLALPRGTNSASAPAALSSADSSKQGTQQSTSSYGNSAQSVTPTPHNGAGIAEQSSSTSAAASATASGSLTKSSAATATQRAVAAQPSPADTTPQPAATQKSQFSLPSLDTPGIRALLGTFLLLLAIIGALLLRLQRKIAGS